VSSMRSRVTCRIKFEPSFRLRSLAFWLKHCCHALAAAGLRRLSHWSSAIQTGAKFGMMLMDDCLFEHWANEKIEMEDALGKAQDPDSLAKRIATARRQMDDGKPAAKRHLLEVGQAVPDD